MKINKQLHLVRQVSDTHWVHSTPISQEEFTSNWRMISRTFSAIMEDGPLTGPRIAHLAMQEQAEKIFGPEDGRKRCRTLMAEIERNTLVLGPSPEGAWESIPFEQAVSKGTLDRAEAEEVRGAVTFFTVGLHMVLQAEQKDLVGSLSLWNAATTSLDSTEYLSFLQTSTRAANSGKPAT